MNDIEEEIRQRILAERTVERPQSSPPSSPPPPQPYYATAPPPQNPSFLQRKQQQGGIVGAIAGALLLIAKFAAPVIALLAKLKFLLVGLKVLGTVASMLLSMWVYAQFYRWPFAIGMVMLIFIHECGHALAARMRGIPSSLMLFIPFMGAFVATKRGGKNIAEDAFIGIMGPVIGTLASLVCVALYFPTGNFFWLALAVWGFFVNLFNLAPTPPLDGGWITPLFSPKLLVVGFVLIVLIGFLNPFIWILGLMSLPRIISGWKADPQTQPYYQATTADRWKFGLAYFGLAAFLGVG